MLAAFQSLYVIIAPLLLVVSFTNGRIRNEAYNCLHVVNTLFPILVIFQILLYGVELLIAWYGQNPYEYYVFRQTGNASVFYFSMIGTYLPIFFFWYKLRTNKWFIVLVLLTMVIPIWVVYVVWSYRDFLPSSWQKENNEWYNELLPYLILVVIIFLIYFILHKRKKLPYPSILLK